MSDPIIPIEMILRKVREAHERGVTVCPFPPFSAAAKTWRDEFARLTAEEVAA